MSPLISLLLLLQILSTFSHNCIHDQLNISVKIHPDTQVQNSRNLQSSYSSIRIALDFTFFDPPNATVDSYIRYQLLPPAVSYFKKVLSVNPLPFPITTTEPTLCQNLTTPNLYLTNGVEADIVFLITGSTEETNYVAWALPCLLLESTGRPVFGQVNYNYNYITGNNANSDIVTTIHEMVHAFGFSTSLFPYYYDPVHNVALTNVVTNDVINDINVQYLSVEPLRTTVRNEFGCSTAVGALLENQGSAGSVRTHFERRVFGQELMTASIIEDPRISKFTLALLASTGWYQVDMTMAEPLAWGNGEGCGFITGLCVTNDGSATAYPKEFCTNLEEIGCTIGGRSQGYCGDYNTIQTNTSLPSSFNYWGNDTQVTDSYSDNCPYYRAFSNAQCEVSANLNSAALKNYEFYGTGSRCFTGYMAASGGTWATLLSYCFAYQCTGSPGSYLLTVSVGNNAVTCSNGGLTYVPGPLECPDPNIFCETAGVYYCPKGCTGNGLCNNNICVCDAGWTGPDCATNQSAVANAIIVGGSSFSNSANGNNNNDSTSSVTLGIIVAAAIGGVIIIFLIYKFIVKKGLCKRNTNRGQQYQTNGNRAPQGPPQSNRVPQSLSNQPNNLYGQDQMSINTQMYRQNQNIIGFNGPPVRMNNPQLPKGFRGN